MPTGPGAGVRAVLAGFDIDRYIDSALGQQYPAIRNKLELIARSADKDSKNIVGLETNFLDNVDVALESYVARLQDFVRYQDKQIRNLRSFLTGDVPKLKIESSIVPSSISADSLALIGGAQLDPQTKEASKDDENNYIVEGVIVVGLLYTGKKIIDSFNKNYYDEFGVSPDLKYAWHHYTPIERELHAHARLDGVTFDSHNRNEVLRNDSEGWLDDTFYPQDHSGCLCLILPEMA